MRGTSLCLWVGNTCTDRRQETLQVAENNWVRGICKVKREDRKKMGKDPNEETSEDKGSGEQTAMDRIHTENE